MNPAEKLRRGQGTLLCPEAKRYRTVPCDTIGFGGALCNSAITSAITNATSESRTNRDGQAQTLPMKNNVTSNAFSLLR